MIVQEASRIRLKCKAMGSLCINGSNSQVWPQVQNMVQQPPRPRSSSVVAALAPDPPGILYYLIEIVEVPC